MIASLLRTLRRPARRRIDGVDGVRFTDGAFDTALLPRRSLLLVKERGAYHLKASP